MYSNCKIGGERLNQVESVNKIGGKKYNTIVFNFKDISGRNKCSLKYISLKNMTT